MKHQDSYTTLLYFALCCGKPRRAGSLLHPWGKGRLLGSWCLGCANACQLAMVSKGPTTIQDLQAPPLRWELLAAW